MIRVPATTALGATALLASLAGGLRAQRVSMADSLVTTGDFERAARVLDSIVDRHPDHPRAVHLLGRSYLELARREAPPLRRRARWARRALGALERAVELAPRSVEVRMDLLEAYVQAPERLGGGVERARAQADTLVGLDPARGELARGRIHSLQGEWSDAEAVFERAAVRWPDRPVFLYELGWVRVQDGNVRGALHAYRRIMRLRPAEWGGHLHFGRTAVRAGIELEAAAEALRTVIHLAEGSAEAPDLDEVRRLLERAERGGRRR